MQYMYIPCMPQIWTVFTEHFFYAHGKHNRNTKNGCVKLARKSKNSACGKWWDEMVLASWETEWDPYAPPTLCNFTTPLLKGHSQCLTFRPSNFQHRPSFSKRHGWMDKRETWIARCVCTQQKHLCCLQRVCIFVSLFLIPSSVPLCRNSNPQMHATNYHWFFISRCTRARIVHASIIRKK